MRIAVYTAITDGYDSLKPAPENWKGSVDFIAYLDRQPDRTDWLYRPACRDFSDPVRNAKIHKIIPEDIFSEYEYSIWVDGSVVIKSLQSAASLVEELLKGNDLAVFRHRTRTCVYEEAKACIAAHKDSAETIARQVNRYKAENYPKNNGVCECTVLVRRHTDALIRFCQEWHAEIVANSRRDQLSIDYVARKLNFTISHIPGNIIANDHFLWVYHDGDGSELRPVVPMASLNSTSLELSSTQKP